MSGGWRRKVCEEVMEFGREFLVGIEGGRGEGGKGGKGVVFWSDMYTLYNPTTRRMIICTS